MRVIYRYCFISILGMSMLFANKGLTQQHLTSISPNSTEVLSKSIFVLTFEMPILEPSVKKSTIVLKQKTPNKQSITTSFSVDNNVLSIYPTSALEKGIYTLKVKPLKLTQEGDNALEVKTTWQKFIAWTCGLFYKDISKCPLCQYFCYTSNVTKTKRIKFSFEVKDDMAIVTQLTANTRLIELSEHNSTNISVIANYEDNSTEDVTAKASYTSSDNSIDIEKGVITSNAEGSATVTIEYGGKSTSVQVEVYEKIEGHLLPHTPDNPDDTLLGVDKNDNGVRDEVERWVYKDMPTYHHPEIERVIAMTKAKAHQMALIDPTNKNDEVHKAIERASNCWAYYSYYRNLPFDATVQKFGNNLRDQSFNTKERLKTYMDYDYTLTGRVFTATPLRLLNTSYCDQNIDVLP